MAKHSRKTADSRMSAPTLIKGKGNTTPPSDTATTPVIGGPLPDNMDAPLGERPIKSHNIALEEYRQRYTFLNPFLSDVQFAELQQQGQDQIVLNGTQFLKLIQQQPVPYVQGWVLLTPIEAAYVRTTHNIGNRQKSQKHVAGLRAKMEAGHTVWKPSNPTTKIVIDRDGIMRNGQHTLEAAEQNNETMLFGFVTGDDPENFSVMDTNRIRSAEDKLFIAKLPELKGVDKLNVVSSMVNRFILGIRPTIPMMSSDLTFQIAPHLHEGIKHIYDLLYVYPQTLKEAGHVVSKTNRDHIRKSGITGAMLRYYYHAKKFDNLANRKLFNHLMKRLNDWVTVTLTGQVASPDDYAAIGLMEFMGKKKHLHPSDLYCFASNQLAKFVKGVSKSMVRATSTELFRQDLDWLRQSELGDVAVSIEKDLWVSSRSLNGAKNSTPRGSDTARRRERIKNNSRGLGIRPDDLNVGDEETPVTNGHANGNGAIDMNNIFGAAE